MSAPGDCFHDSDTYECACGVCTGCEDHKECPLDCPDCGGRLTDKPEDGGICKACHATENDLGSECIHGNPELFCSECVEEGKAEDERDALANGDL